MDSKVYAHIERITSEAGLGVMAQILEIVGERGQVTTDTLLGLTVDDVENFYHGYIGHAVDVLEDVLLTTEVEQA